MSKRGKQKKYSKELKLQAINSYLNGEGGLWTVSKKYGIIHCEQLRRWVLWYNGHKEIKGSSSAKGEIYMTKGRKTTQEERAEIVAFCIEHNYDYGLTVETFGVSYNQIYSWVQIGRAHV